MDSWPAGLACLRVLFLFLQPAGALQQAVESVLAELCSAVCQQAVQDAIACWVFIFRQEDARSQYQPLVEGMLGQTRLPDSLTPPATPAIAAVPSHSRLSPAASATGQATSPTSAGAAVAVKAGRLLGGDHVPHTHKAWTGEPV